jgi:hypothetical protein
MDRKYVEIIKNVCEGSTEYLNIVNMIFYCEELEFTMKRSQYKSFYCNNIITNLFSVLELFEIVVTYQLSKFIISNNIPPLFEQAQQFLETKPKLGQIDTAESILRKTSVVRFEGNEQELYMEFRALRNNVHLARIGEDIKNDINNNSNNLKKWQNFIYIFIDTVGVNYSFWVNPKINVKEKAKYIQK